MVHALISLLYAALCKTEARLLEWPMVEEDAWLRFREKRSSVRAVPLHVLALQSVELVIAS
jgi:hypothetical protein